MMQEPTPVDTFEFDQKQKVGNQIEQSKDNTSQINLTQQSSENPDISEIPQEFPTRKSARAPKPIPENKFKLYSQKSKLIDLDSDKNEDHKMQCSDQQSASKDEEAEVLVPSPIEGSDRQIYKSLWIEENNEGDHKTLCDVCMDADDSEDDEMVMCDGCNVAVHQQCYGQGLIGVKVDELDSWLCQRCEKVYNEKQGPEVVQCRACEDLQGVIKESNQGWMHLTCVNWIPEIEFYDKEKTKVIGVLNKERLGLYCHICKDPRRKGMVLQCDYKNCQQNFHVRCGIEEKYIRDWESMNEQREKEDSLECYLFCKNHKTEGILTLQSQGKQGLNPIPEKEYKALSKINQQFSNQLKISNKAQNKEDDYEYDCDQKQQSDFESECESDDGDSQENSEKKPKSRQRKQKRLRKNKPAFSRPKASVEDIMQSHEDNSVQMGANNQNISNPQQMMEQFMQMISCNPNLNQQQQQQMMMSMKMMTTMQQCGQNPMQMQQFNDPMQQIPSFNNNVPVNQGFTDFMQTQFQSTNNIDPNHGINEAKRPSNQPLKKSVQSKKIAKKQKPTYSSVVIKKKPIKQNPPTPTSNTEDQFQDCYIVDPTFAKLIGLESNPSTLDNSFVSSRDQIQLMFIQFAIQNNMVNENNPNHYDLSNFAYISGKVGADKIEAKYLFNYLKVFLTKINQ